MRWVCQTFSPSSLSTSLCLQESISDFYWYYSGKDIIDDPGKRNFSKAMTVAKQVFNSLTEYIQVGKQRMASTTGVCGLWWPWIHNKNRAKVSLSMWQMTLVVQTLLLVKAEGQAKVLNCLKMTKEFICIFIIYVAFLLHQGPCTGNQQSLAHSRLWDAVVGFLHVFAHMMMKLAQVRDITRKHKFHSFSGFIIIINLSLIILPD